MDKNEIYNVAPFAGAWIEILRQYNPLPLETVAPFAGAWIEILSKILVTPLLFVAPFAGAWIEIEILYLMF